MSQYSQENPVSEPLFDKVAGACNFTRETSTQVFLCEHCDFFKNSHFEEHQQTGASVY